MCWFAKPGLAANLALHLKQLLLKVSEVTKTVLHDSVLFMKCHDVQMQSAIPAVLFRLCLDHVLVFMLKGTAMGSAVGADR